MAQIRWMNDLDQACGQAGREGKLVFLDFFSPV